MKKIHIFGCILGTEKGDTKAKTTSPTTLAHQCLHGGTNNIFSIFLHIIVAQIWRENTL